MADRFDDLKDTMNHGFNSLHARFDGLDKRVRDTETDVAILQDRHNRESRTASRWGGFSGSIGGFLGGLLSGWMSK